MLSDPEFQLKAGEALEALNSKLGDAAGDFDFDVDLQNGALTIEFEDPRERFVISPNSPVRQIWVSAHVQSFKLDWQPETGAFVLPATGQTLEALLIDCIRRRIPEFTL